MIDKEQYQHMSQNELNAKLLNACFWGHLEVVQYVVIDMNMKIDEDTMSWLRANNEQKKVYQDTIRLIEKRNLYHKFNKNNTNKDIKGKNFKL